MKLLKPSWRVCLLAVGSFLLGVLASHVPVARAQGAVRVYYVGVSPVKSPTIISGQVVGFSCVPADKDGPAACFIAAQ